MLKKVNHQRGVLLLANVLITCWLSRQYINSGRGGAVRHFVQWVEVKEVAESSLGGKGSDADRALGGLQNEVEEAKKEKTGSRSRGAFYIPGQEAGEGKGGSA